MQTGLGNFHSLKTKNSDSYKCDPDKICAQSRENLMLLHANNKNANQPAHSHSLISAFVIHYLSSKKSAIKI